MKDKLIFYMWKAFWMRQVSELIRTIFIFAAQLQVQQKLREGLDRCDAEPSIFKAAFSLCTAVDVYGARDRGPDAPSDDNDGAHREHAFKPPPTVFLPHLLTSAHFIRNATVGQNTNSPRAQL
jgi:hypothetical protein